MALGLGEKPPVAGRHHGVQSKAPGRSRPKGTASQALLQVQLESLLIGPVPKGQQLREQAEKARAPYQEPVASR